MKPVTILEKFEYGDLFDEKTKKSRTIVDILHSLSAICIL